MPLYADWNSKINVVSRKDIDQLYTHHVLHSLAIAKFISFPIESKILDIGTGGGFPGIPLAILFPKCHFLLVDSIGKKIKVVHEVASALGLTNVQAEHTRVEQVKGQFEFIVSRAVAPAQKLYQWTHNLCHRSKGEAPNGYLLLKGGDLEEELNELKKPYSLTDLNTYFDDRFFDTKKLVYIPF